MGWVVLGAGLAMLYVFNKRVNPYGKGTKAVAIITMLLAAIAGCGLAYTVGGKWIAGGIGFVGKGLAEVAHEPNLVLAVSVTVTVVTVGVAVADISFDKKADKGAQFAAVLMPTLLALVIGGSMGKTGGDAVQTVNDRVGSIVKDLGGDGNSTRAGRS